MTFFRLEPERQLIDVLVLQLFKGIFYYCEGPDAEFITNKTQCLELAGNGNKWINHKYNFDNLGQALMSLFVLSSKDGWVNIMYQGLDAVGLDQQVWMIFYAQFNIFCLKCIDISHLCSLARTSTSGASSTSSLSSFWWASSC